MKKTRIIRRINTLKTWLFAWALLLIAASNAVAQTNGIEMADQLRRDGKIWVVVGVILLIFAGVVLYLIRLDLKISKLEKQHK